MNLSDSNTIQVVVNVKWVRQTLSSFTFTIIIVDTAAIIATKPIAIIVIVVSIFTTIRALVVIIDIATTAMILIAISLMLTISLH